MLIPHYKTQQSEQNGGGATFNVAKRTTKNGMTALHAAKAGEYVVRKCDINLAWRVKGKSTYHDQDQLPPIFFFQLRFVFTSYSGPESKGVWWMRTKSHKVFFIQKHTQKYIYLE